MFKKNQKMKTKKIACIIFIITLICIYPVYKIERAWICSYSGSVKGYERIFFFIKRNSYHKTSVLEKQLRIKYKNFKNNWISIAKVSSNFFGKKYEHQKAPPIIQIPYDLYPALIKNMSESELENLYEILKNGSRKEQESTITNLLNSHLD